MIKNVVVLVTIFVCNLAFAGSPFDQAFETQQKTFNEQDLTKSHNGLDLQLLALDPNDIVKADFTSASHGQTLLNQRKLSICKVLGFSNAVSAKVAENTSKQDLFDIQTNKSISGNAECFRPSLEQLVQLTFPSSPKNTALGTYKSTTQTLCQPSDVELAKRLGLTDGDGAGKIITATYFTQITCSK